MGISMAKKNAKIRILFQLTKQGRESFSISFWLTKVVPESFSKRTGLTCRKKGGGHQGRGATWA